MEEKEDVIVLVDEEGEEHHFVVVDLLPVNENRYAILLPAAGEDGNGEFLDEDSDEGEEAYIFRLVEKEGEQALEAVEDEEEWSMVAEEWENRIKEMEKEDSYTNNN